MKKNLLLLTCALAALSLRAETLTLSRTIPLTGGAGKLDHSTVDRAGGRLFVSASGKNAIKVIDLKQGAVVATIPDMAAPQGVLYVPELGRLYVANEKDGTLRVLDGKDYTPIASVPLGDDADNIRYDARTNRLYVGYEDGILGAIDAKTNQLLAKIPLKAHPEAFALATGSGQVILNTPNAHNVTVYDRASDKVVAEWPMGTVGDNFTIALDEANQRAFVGSRKPAYFFVFNLQTGAEVARLPLHGNTDDFHYDAKRRQIYASCGEGYIDVFTQIDADHYALKEAVKTAPGGRTSAFDGDTIYLNVQSSAKQAAEVRCYTVN